MQNIIRYFILYIYRNVFKLKILILVNQKLIKLNFFFFSEILQKIYAILY